jgi:integrase
VKPPPKKNPLGRGCIPGFTLVRAGVGAKGIQRGAGLWEFTLRGPGGKPSRTLVCAGWQDAMSEAQKQVAEWKKAEGQPKKPGAWTFSETVTRYLASLRDKDRANEGTMRAEAAWIRLVIAPYFVDELKNPAVDTITEEQVREWMKKYGKAPTKRGPVSDSTIHHRVRVLRALFRFAVKKGMRTANPAEDFVVHPKAIRKGGDQRPHYPLDPAEMAVLQAWLDEYAPPSVAFAIRLAAAVGLRDQEATHLRLEDLTLKGQFVRVAHFDCGCAYCKRNRDGERRTKTSTERLVVLPYELVEPFREYLRRRAEQVPGHWTFPIWSAIRSGRRKAGAQLGPGTLNDWLAKAVKAAELPVDPARQRLVAHSLRAFSHTEVQKRSKDYEAVAVLLGHALPGMGSRYSTLSEQPAALVEALNFGPPRKGLAIVA